MRLICTISPEESNENPFEFSFYLAGQGIENECEEVSVEKQAQYRIWVYEEDMVEKAQAIYKDYQQNPSDPSFKVHFQRATQVAEAKEEELIAPQPRRRRILSAAPYGPVSILLLVVVIGLFFWAQIGRHDSVTPPTIPGVIAAPVFSPIERLLSFDYPPYFILRDNLLKVYTAKDIADKKPPTIQAKSMISELKKTPNWMGLYDQIVFLFQGQPIPINYQGPLFGDVLKGQVWRLFSPALLHFDFLHLFFNVLWFILLGNQIEYRIGPSRYLGMVLVLGIATNIGQYLMSGPFFMGLSGIVCGMAAFIWARQQVAPWEGYLLHRFTLVFLGIFVIGMFLLQLIFFMMQTFGTFELNVGIANTAHITGAVLGYLMGRMRKFFALKERSPVK